MKKLLLTLAVVAVAVMAAYAEEKTGTVVSTENNQLIVDENGTQVNFAVKADAKILDSEGNALELGALTAGSKVKVEYSVTPEGQNEVSAISEEKEVMEEEVPEAPEEVKE